MCSPAEQDTNNTTTGVQPRLQPLERVGPCPLSFSQERLWFLNQFEPDSSLYNISRVFDLEGELDRRALGKALNKIVERHEVLRTAFQSGEKGPVQVIAPKVNVVIAEFDVSGLREGRREAEVGRLLDHLAKKPYDLSRDLMLRAAFLRLGEARQILVLSMHHIAADGWSLGVFFRELNELYAAYASGKEPQLPELPVQYADFAMWQREVLSGPVLEEELRYWRSRLEGSPALLQLPADRPRPAIQTFHGAAEIVDLGTPLSDAVREFARRERVTVYMVLLAVFQVLLSRYSGQTDVLVGSPIAGRLVGEVEDLIGFFVNTLVMRADLTGNPTFLEHLQQVRRGALDAYSHQELPFEKLVDSLNPERNLAHSPLVQVMFVLQNTPAVEPSLPGLQVREWRVRTATAKFDLLLSLDDQSRSIQGDLEYNTDLFDRETIRRMLGHYRNLLVSVLRDPGQRISRIPLITPSERDRILNDWNATAAPYPDLSLTRRFERQAQAAPNAVAVRCEGRDLTYSDLNGRANRLAQELRLAGAGPGTLVGTFQDRSIEAVIAILGIVKSGAAYLPLDPSYPQPRLTFMLEDAGLQIVLPQRSRMDRLPEGPYTTIFMDSLPETALTPDAPEGSGPDGLLYVLYTSGSTGQPKGVAMPQRVLMNLISWQETRLRNEPGIRVAQFAPLSFDVSCQEIFSTLVSGGTLIIVPEPLRRDPEGLWRFLEQERIERLFLPYVVLEQMAEVGAPSSGLALREVVTAGEQLRITPKIRRLFAAFPECALINQYGPTETHVVTGFPLAGPPEAWPDLPPIGRPIANAQIYILDAEGALQPPGLPGEIYAGGDCLARGYWSRPELTAERFVANPFDPTGRSKLYRTGDVGRYLAGGDIEFLGRSDGQVKVRGFRIELGEIEVTLGAHPAVAGAAAAVYELGGDKLLAAYVVKAQGAELTERDLRRHLAERMPAYMLPSRIVFLDRLPRTPSGKVDRQALPRPEAAADTAGRAPAAPGNETESKLAQIWERLLRIRTAGINQDFFDLGGHSLLAARLASAIEKEFGRRIPLPKLFTATTIERQARLLSSPGSAPPAIVGIQPEGSRIPFYMVNALPIFRPLGKRLGRGQPFYSLALPVVHELPMDYTIDDIVRPLLHTLLEEQPEGPYCVGGWCRYGLIAFELARRLKERGKDVALLALFDAMHPAAAEKPGSGLVRFTGAQLLQWEFQYHLACLRQLGKREAAAYLAGRAGKLLWAAGRRLHRLFTRSTRTGDEDSDLLGFYPELLLSVRGKIPEAYDGTVTLFKAEEAERHCRCHPAWGWDSVVRGRLEVRTVPGDHLSMFLEPNVSILARELESCLEQVQPKEHGD